MKYKVNISVDDVSPHPRSSILVVERCFEILKKIPQAKFTLFVPMAYFRSLPQPAQSMNEFPLEIQNYPNVCSALKNLDPDVFEIAYHGVLHGIPGVSNNDEFRDLNYSEAIDRLRHMFEIAKLAKLDKLIKPIFRPPAYRMSPEAIRAARDMGIKLLCLSPEEMYKQVYQGEEEKKDDVVYSTCGPPVYPLQLEEKTEIVYHACEWDRNYLSVEKTEELVDFLSNDIDDIDFCFIEGLL